MIMIMIMISIINVCLFMVGPRHGADDITEGERLNLIVWNKNSEYRRFRGLGV